MIIWENSWKWHSSKSDLQGEDLDRQEPLATLSASQMALVVKYMCVCVCVCVCVYLSANARDERDMGSISGSGRSLGGGDGNPLQHSCLENTMDRGVWLASVHGVAKSHT